MKKTRETEYILLNFIVVCNDPHVHLKLTLVSNPLIPLVVTHKGDVQFYISDRNYKNDSKL